MLVEYDPTGNPISRLPVTAGDKEYFAWDDDNRAIEIDSHHTTQTNSYDAQGLRVIRSGGDGHET